MPQGPQPEKTEIVEIKIDPPFSKSDIFSSLYIYFNWMLLPLMISLSAHFGERQGRQIPDVLLFSPTEYLLFLALTYPFAVQIGVILFQHSGRFNLFNDPSMVSLGEILSISVLYRTKTESSAIGRLYWCILIPILLTGVFFGYGIVRDQLPLTKPIIDVELVTVIITGYGITELFSLKAKQIISKADEAIVREKIRPVDTSEGKSEE